MTPRLTESQEKRLYGRLTFDELLYRKFRRLQEEVEHKIADLWRNPQHVREVVGVQADGLRFLLPVLRLTLTEDGTVVEVGLPTASSVLEPSPASPRRAPSRVQPS